MTVSAPMNSITADYKELKRPSNSWTSESGQRTALALYKRLYKNDWDDCRTLWHKCFHRELFKDGFFQFGLGKSGITTASLKAQYGDLVRKCHRDYRTVHETPFADVRVRFSTIIDRLLKAANEAGIVLLGRSVEEDASHQAQAVPCSLKRNRDISSSYDSDSSSTEVGELQDSDDEKRRGRKRNRIPLSQWSAASRRRRDDLDQVNGETPPTLLFRTYSKSSAGVNGPLGFRAGDPDSPLAMTEDNDKLVKCAAIHLNAAKDGEGNFIPTPFISTTNSLIFALQKAAKLKKGGCEPRISFIHCEKIDTPVHYAKDLVHSVERAGLKYGRRYRGTYEYWILSELPAEAVICDISYRSLCAVAETEPALGQVFRLDLLESGSVSKIRDNLNYVVSGAALDIVVTRFLHWLAPIPCLDNGRLFDELRNVICRDWKCLGKTPVRAAPPERHSSGVARTCEQASKEVLMSSATNSSKSTAKGMNKSLWSPYEDLPFESDPEESPCLQRVARRLRGV